jgi:hypothetical protein
MRNLISVRRLHRTAVLASAIGLGSMALLGATGASASAAAAPRAAANPEMGIEWFPTPNAASAQCGSPTIADDWAAAPNWTAPILIDTDNRVGGCELAFGVYDPSQDLNGISIQYSWGVSPGGDAGQCDNPGTYPVPISEIENFSTLVTDDSDNRAGWCSLTFTVSGALASGGQFGLNIQFYPTPDADAGQCNGYLPEGDYYTATPGSPVTIGLDTDGRGGGCELSLRLQEGDSFGPVKATARNAHGAYTS